MSKLEENNLVWRGIIATVGIVLFSLWFSSLFSFEIYTGWVAFIWMTAVPAQMVIGVHLGFQHPVAVKNLPQPKKGFVYLGVTAVAMILGGAFLFFVPGRMEAPGPFLINATIMTIVATFWLVAAWQSWPLALITNKPVFHALLLLVVAHLVGYGMYLIFFNFNTMDGSPLYNHNLDPNGLFDAWYALSFSVTSVAALMVMSLFDFLPCTKFSTRQPFLGLRITCVALTISGIVFWLFICLLKKDPVIFMVDISVSVIFGVFLVSNMMSFRLFERIKQPARGFLLLTTAVAAAYSIQLAYRFVANGLFSTPLASGGPTYELQIWLATALLAITFPLINFVSGYFTFWPLKQK